VSRVVTSDVPPMPARLIP